MARKLFQIGFILLVIAAFGTVFNHYLKNKISDPNDYLNYIESFPQNRISIIDPIIVKFPRSFDKTDYSLNTPLNSKIIEFDPEVKGTLYWSDQRTLEFYPDAPLVSNSDYMVKVDINKIYQQNSKVKLFRFKLSTFKQVFYVNEGVFEPIDNTLVNQWYKGSIVFNDFIDFDDVNTLFSAVQKGEELDVSFKPGKLKDSYLFVIENIKRHELIDTLQLNWNGKPIGLNLIGSKQIMIPSLNEFGIQETELVADSTFKLKIGFSDPLDNKQRFDSLVWIKGANVSDYKCVGKYLILTLPDSSVQQVYLRISKNIKNVIGIPLQSNIAQIVEVEKNIPALRKSDSTYIISEFTDNFHWQFEALKLKEVNVQVYKIFSNNVLQFLQTNNIQGINQIERVGTIVYKNKMKLTDQLQYDPEKWTQYQININNFEPEEGCIYSVLIDFNSDQTTLGGINNKSTVFNEQEQNNSFGDSISKQFYDTKQGIHHNLYFTELSILTKQVNADSLYVWVNDINTLYPSSAVNIKVLNYQQQVIAKGVSDNDGKVRFKLKEQPSFIVAQQGGNTTFLKIESNSLKNENNSKVFFFKQRKYWSSGDTLNLCFIHNASIKTLPNSLLSLNIFSPNKKKIFTELKATNKTNKYLFSFLIPKGISPGIYRAEISVGSMLFNESFEVLPSFEKQMKVEMSLLNETELFYEYQIKAINNQLFSHQATYEVNMVAKYKKHALLNKYTGYEFCEFNNDESEELHSGLLNADGSAILKIRKKKIKGAANVSHTFYAIIVNRNQGFTEFEKTFSYDINKSSVGIYIVNNKKHNSLFYCDSVIDFKFILVDSKQKINRRKTNGLVKVFTLNNSTYELYNSEKIQFVKGVCNWNTLLKFPEQGVFRIVVQAYRGNVQASKTIQLNWPEAYHFNLQKNNNDLFHFSADTVTEGDSIGIDFKSFKPGKLLIAIDNQNGVNYTKWHEVVVGMNDFKIPVFGTYFPKVDVFTSLYSKNLLPVINTKSISINNNIGSLKPVIYGLNEVEAEKGISVTIKEENNNALNYVIMVSPANQTESSDLKYLNSLSNSSFDYSSVSTNIFGSSLSVSNITNENTIKSNIAHKANSSPFHPFDIMYGPYFLQAGESNIHTVKMPQFIGNVNICVIASDENNREFKSVTHEVSVQKSLMILTSAPDIISPNEEFNLPINVFSSTKEAREAKVELLNTIDLNIVDDLEKSVTLNHIQTDTTNFKIKSKRRTGIGSIDIVAKDSLYEELRTINIPIKNNVSIENRWVVKELGEKKTWQTRFTPIGIKGTNYATIEYSEFENIHFSQLLIKLLNNTNPDIEHLVSSSFPLLYINHLTDIDIDLNNEFKEKIQNALNKLIYYQLPSGGFSYWPNRNEAQHWCSAYVGWFMIEAQEHGYEINQAIYNKWLRYQRRKCLTWNYSIENSDLEQAFGLYALALAQKPDINSMQKLMNKKLSIPAAFQLSMAFSVIGKNKVAAKLQSAKGQQYTYLNDRTLGNPLRNIAIEFDAYRMVKNNKKVDSLKTEIEKYIIDPDYQSLQGIALSLITLAKYYNEIENIITKEISYTVNRGKEELSRSAKPFGVIQIPIEFTLAKTIDINNTGEGNLNLSLDYGGSPLKVDAVKPNPYIKGTLSFKNFTGKEILQGEVRIDNQIKAEVQLKPIMDNLYSNYMVMVFPLANCFDFISLFQLGDPNIKYIHQTKNKVLVYFTLPNTGVEFNIPLKAKHKGYFNQPPVEIHSLYNPMVNTTLTGKEFTVR